MYNVDVDECADPDLHDCDGSLNGTDVTLMEFDPSDMNGTQVEVAGVCHNSFGSFWCRCPDYYLWDSNSSRCIGE